jgi:hypothetical protein
MPKAIQIWRHRDAGRLLLEDFVMSSIARHRWSRRHLRDATPAIKATVSRISPSFGPAVATRVFTQNDTPPRYAA